MTDPTPTLPGEPPSARQLLRSTIVAAIVASVLLVTVMFPAEYGRDPTRIGGLLGLTEMGEVKMRLAREAERERHHPGAPAPSPVAAVASRSDVTSISLAPNQSKEVKLSMRQGAPATFSWSTDKGAVSYDLHVDRAEGGAHSYRKGKGVSSDEGTFDAITDGWHGWYWKNRTEEVVTITLRTSGDYREIKEIK